MLTTNVYLCVSILFLITVFGGEQTDACGGEITGLSGTIESPNYPFTYPDFANCQWDILAPPGRTIILNFTEFFLEPCACDKVTVESLFSGNVIETHGQFHGLKPPTSIKSVGNYLRIKFTSDNGNSPNLNSLAFKAVFTTISEKGQASFVADITTIYSLAESEATESYGKDERDPIEVHFRTNAFGLDNYLSDVVPSAPTLMEDDPIGCSKDSCLWEKENMRKVLTESALPLEFTDTSSRMTSPSFFPKGEKVCLVVYLTAGHLSHLVAYALTSTGKEIYLDEYTSTQIVYNFAWRLHVSIDNGNQDGVKIMLWKTSHQPIEINNIVNCYDSDNAQVVSLTKVQVPDVEAKIKEFDPMSFGFSAILHGLQCQNGGVYTEVGCACPAGFRGLNCSEGCGANQFGQDCGGKCSVRSAECRGLLLCTPGVGCLCAPGYYGPECSQKCTNKNADTPDQSVKYYGASCTQECGHCSEEAPQCNIYTGRCTGGCANGYLEPYCKLKLVHPVYPPELSLPEEYGVISTLINLNSSNRVGDGSPVYYQIQYKKFKDDKWIAYETKDISEKAEDHIEIRGLEDGTVYSVRMIYILAKYEKYDEDYHVPQSEIRTKCYVPTSYDYKVSVDHTKDLAQENDSSVDTFISTFTWMYDIKEKWCPNDYVAISYKTGFKWITHKTAWTTNFTMSNILPNQKIVIKVQAVTDDLIQAPSSTEFSTVTPAGGKYSVENASTSNIGTNTLTLQWSVSPITEESQQLDYNISYQCLERAACKNDCSESRGEISTSDTSAVLRGLLPASRYRISVSANGVVQPAVLFVGTESSNPTEIPQERKDNGYGALNRSSHSTNTTATVQWERGEICSGYFKNFLYELYEVSEPNQALESGKTKMNEKTFLNLRPNTDYVVRIFIETNAGINSKTFLKIDASTDATVPEQVRNLTVYKQGQHMLGVRWARPRLVYGELDGFTISYWQKNLPASKKSTRIEPTLCTSWPELYCHTVQALRPGQTYNVAVSALNKNKQDPGESSFVSGLTREKSPGPPENLKMVNVTSTTVTVQWDPPFLQNGVLRTFLVSVEETETHNEEACCQTFPVMEKAVTAEVLHHQLEISGLNPASTYSISITGRTNGFGPAQTLSVTTAPPPLLVTLPQQLVLDCGDMVWMSQENTSHASDSVYQSLVVYRCILILQNSTANSVANIESGIKDERLKELLDDRLEPVYYLAAEYEEADAVNIPGEEGRFDSKWGRSQARTLGNTTLYQLAAVQVTEYNGVLNADILLSTPFTSC